MNINRITFASCMIGTLILAGCQKASESPKPVSSTSGTATPATSPAQSVATPPNALPPSDAAMKPPGQGAPDSGNAGTPTQSNPAELSKSQEQTAMPQSGQVNNHSVPDTTSQKK